MASPALQTVPQQASQAQSNIAANFNPILLDRADPNLSEEEGIIARFDAALSATQFKNSTPTSPNSTFSSIQNDPNPIFRQINAALQATSDGSIELKLWPEEIGRVRLTMTASESGMIVQLAAERSEVLDLMRKHIGQLEQELLEQGFDNLSFSFGHEEPETSDPEQIRTGAGPAEILNQTAFVAPPIIGGRVDIRL